MCLGGDKRPYCYGKLKSWWGHYGYCHPGTPKTPCCSTPSMHVKGALSPHYKMPAGYTSGGTEQHRRNGSVPMKSDLPPLDLPPNLTKLNSVLRPMWESYLALVYGRKLTPQQVARLVNTRSNSIQFTRTVFKP